MKYISSFHYDFDASQTMQGYSILNHLAVRSSDQEYENAPIYLTGFHLDVKMAHLLVLILTNMNTILRP